MEGHRRLPTEVVQIMGLVGKIQHIYLSVSIGKAGVLGEGHFAYEVGGLSLI